MSLAAQIFVNGVLQGGLLALVAVGFSLVWGVLGSINLAQGPLVVLGAYLTWLLVDRAGMVLPLAVAASVAAMFVLGYALQRGLLNLVARGSLLVGLLLSFGVGLALDNVLTAVFSSDYRSINQTQAVLDVAGVFAPESEVVALGLAVATTASVAVLLNRTRAGLAIKAVGMDTDAARLMGVPVRHVYALTFALAAASAGLAGAMVATTGTFSPASADPYTLDGFVIAVVGGVGDTVGCFYAALALGLAESVAAQYLSGSLVSAIAFAFLIAALIVRPQGVLGRARFAARMLR